MDQLSHLNSCWENLRLHITSDFFYIEAVDSPEKDTIIIDRNSYSYTSPDGQYHNQVKIQISRNPSIPAARSIHKIDAFLGVLNLIAGNYLIVVTKRSRMGTLHSGHSIYKIDNTELISFSRNTLATLNAAQRQHNEAYINMVKNVLSTPSFYYSPSYDLTHSIQRLNDLTEQNKHSFYNQSLLHRADSRFLWNQHLLKPILSSNNIKIARFGMPIIHGFIAINNTFVNGRMFDWSIISRRSTKRAGTRYYMRGSDHRGNVANYVETEQIIYFDRKIASLVQTRGSIPLIWSQRPNLRYKPDVKIQHSSENEPLHLHFNEQMRLYGDHLMLNLIKRKDHWETGLSVQLKQAVDLANYKNLEYLHFDFAKECSKMRWHRLNILMDQIKPNINNFGYFLSDSSKTDQNDSPNSKIYNKQSGVIRTNCIDCLDRTNVVQSMIAKCVLTKQLQKFNILSPTEEIDQHNSLIKMFKTTWADNGDYIANQYTGTPALKSDFTRTGKRGYKGLMLDGYKSIVRYFKNNFNDGNKQDSIDLFLGNYLISEYEDVSIQCPLIIRKNELIGKGLPVIMFLLIGILLLSLIIPARSNKEQIFYIIFTFSLLIFATKFFLKHGYDFVDAPKLVETKDKVD